MFSFASRVKRAIKRCGDDSEAAADEFHGLYEGPVLGGDDTYEGLMKLPRPYRELAAAHQCWGIISSDGFENYIESTDTRFDAEVEAGLKLTGHGGCFSAVVEARQILEGEGRLTEDEDDRLWKTFYDPIENYHELVGDFLVKYVRGA